MKASVVSPLEGTAFLASIAVFIIPTSRKRDADHSEQRSSKQSSEKRFMH
jgi:hypothetical protein